MVKLIGMLSHFRPVKVAVVGDFMVDTYTIGKIKRISPEAPVSVLNVQSEESRPGGAGNVVLNLMSLGTHVVAIGRVGHDAAGKELIHSLETEGVSTEGIIFQKGFKTPVKNRLIADAQQVLRVDFETISSLPNQDEKTITEKIPLLLEGVDILAVSDYGKGFLTRSLLAALIRESRKRNIPVIVDPKGDDFTKYSGATIIKPNLSEAYAAAKLSSDTDLDKVAETILKQCSVDQLLITRSEAGMSLFDKSGEHFNFPVRSKEVKDVTGAGDTVLAMISAALANGLDIKSGAQLANLAAGIAIERVGCVCITLSDIAERLLEYDIDNKVFDEEHLFALQQALKGKRYMVLGLDSHKGMTTAIFRGIRKLSLQHPEMRLVVYVRDNSPDEEFIHLLSSLADVDFIVLKCDSLKNLCEIIHPHGVFVIEGRELVSLETPEPLLTRS